MRRAVVFSLTICLGTVVPAAAAPILSTEGPVGLSQDLLIPALPQWPRLSGGRTDPSGRAEGGSNPGVTTPLVPAPKNGDAAGKPPVLTQADRLDDLFQRLAQAGDGDQARTIAVAIQHLWLQSGSDTADLLMVRAVVALGKGDSKLASQLLDKIVTLDPDWAEAWNKRATLRFLDGDDAGAMEDIAHVLAVEPRHFGALSGMAFILQRNGMKKAALATLRKAAAIYPHNAELEKLQSELQLDVEGRDI